MQRNCERGWPIRALILGHVRSRYLLSSRAFRAHLFGPHEEADKTPSHDAFPELGAHT